MGGFIEVSRAGSAPIIPRQSPGDKRQPDEMGKGRLVIGCTMNPARPSSSGKRRTAMATGERVGEVVHVFDKIMVAVLRLTAGIRQGDRLHFLGRLTDFEEQITSMQVEHQPVVAGGPGREGGVQLGQPVRRGDAVYLLKE